ncbi:MAG TPA: hypothetical protein VF427_04360 [Noviherbaspirillum sp.]
MAFKITETEQRRLDKGAQELEDLRGKLEEGLRVYNKAVKAAWDQLQQLVDPYEDKARQLYAILEDIKSTAEDEFDDKSDDWKDSNLGEATQEWIDTIDEAMTSLEDPVNLPDMEELDAESVLLEDLSEIINTLDTEPQK